MKKIFTKFFALIGLMLIGGGNSAWATDYDYSISVTRTISQDCKTSTWDKITINSGSAITGVTAAGDGMIVDATGKVTAGGAQGNYKANAIVWLEVPSASAAGSITFGNGSATDRYFQMESGTKVATKSDTKNFTSSDIVTVDGKYYLKLTSVSDCKLNSFTIALTSGTYVSLSKLTAPTISDDSNGNVTITGGSNVKYTVDGSNPTTSQTATAYKGSFSVEDGTIVNAASVGDGTTTASSDVVSKTILVAGSQIATPVITAINGTVKISCETAGATIKYSTDGVAYNNYAGAFTLTSDATVYAKAVRDGSSDSDVASQTVTVVSKGEANASITLYYDANKVSKPEYSTLTYGDWKLELLNSAKEWSQGALDNANVAVNGESQPAIKVSNGAQNQIVVPDGFKVTRLTFYSVVNGTPASNVLWGEVNGTKYTNVTQIPMENTNGSTPDVRVFGLDEAEGNITFTNAGVQLCFAVVIDYIDANALAESDLALSSSTANVNVNNSASVTFTSTSIGNVTVSSDKTSIATASVEGNTITITGVAAGTATITVSQEADETYSAGSKTITVTVVDPYAPSVVYNWNTVGTTTLGGADEGGVSATSETVKIKNVSTNGVKFPNGINKPCYMKVSAEGGFKAGDVISWTGCINHADSNKDGAITIVADALDGETLLESSDKFNNTNNTSVEATKGSFTLTKDAECLYIGRATSGLSSATATWLTQLTISRPATVASPTLNAYGYATFSCEYNVQITDAKAYKGTISGDALVCEEIENGLVPAGEGVILVGDPSATATALYVASAPAVSSNDIKATTLADGSLATLESCVVLSGDTFVPFNGASFTANKAYLPYAISGARLRMVFGGEANGISDVNVKAVAAPAKYIVNGKLVIEKAGKMFNAAGAQIK